MYDDEIADLMSDWEDGVYDDEMSDAEIAALKASQAKLARDLADDLDMSDAQIAALKAANLDTGDAEIAREVLATLREVQALGDELLALADRKKRPN